MNLDSDSRTIASLKGRDPGAMTALYDRYRRIVYSLVYRIIGNGGEAEEIVQDIFLRVWMRAHLIDDSRTNLGPWLLTIARNLALDYLRKARRRERGLVRAYDFDSFAVYSEPALRFFDYAERLRSAFANLPAEQRDIIELAYFEGLSQAEISVRLGRPLGTVKTKMRVALGKLRKSFDEPARPVNQIEEGVETALSRFG